MMTKMTLKELGEQYAAEADSLEAMIAACKERRRYAIQGGNSAEATRQERLIELHAQQRGDLLQLSVWLRRYYEKTIEKEKGDCHARCYSCVA